ncbi:RICIN domain-containing protein [Flagellimonas amoyensis]|uniref:RICIN domain-containing protein n=1 Tax=Flagellimonas amoyensis TaxID=2169401 RepID=UPI00131EF9CC|nr:RICIN domain-containing protein [Allomuricauda amoyensis]
MQNQMNTSTTQFFLSILLALWTSVSVNAQVGLEQGDYFIANVGTGRALTPVDAGMNSNTHLKPFNKSGMQKWTVKKYTTKDKNGNEAISYTIQHVASGLYLRP